MRAIDIDVFASLFSAGVSGSLGHGLAVGGGGTSPFLNGVAVMKGAGNIPSGSSPGMVTPRRGIEADHVRTNVSAKQRSCESASREGRIAARRLVSSGSLHCVWMLLACSGAQMSGQIGVGGMQGVV